MFSPSLRKPFLKSHICGINTQSDRGLNCRQSVVENCSLGVVLEYVYETNDIFQSLCSQPVFDFPPAVEGCVLLPLSTGKKRLGIIDFECSSSDSLI